MLFHMVSFNPELNRMIMPKLDTKPRLSVSNNQAVTEKSTLEDTVGSQSFCEEGLSIQVANDSLGTIGLF